MELIDKAAIVAKIERKHNKEVEWMERQGYTEYHQGLRDGYANILSCLDTIKVKEVDLEDTKKEELAQEYYKEEPVSSIWHDASEPPIIDKTFLLVAHNGNSSLCLWGGKELHSVTIGGGHSVLCKGDMYSYIDDLLNLDNSCNYEKNLQEEPASEKLENAAIRYADEEYNRKSPANLPDRCRGCYTPLMYAFKAGAKWKEQQIMSKAINDVEINSRRSDGRFILSGNFSRFETGDKVKLIIIKQE